MSKERRVFPETGFNFWLNNLQEHIDLSAVTIADIGMIARAMRMFCIECAPGLGLYDEEAKDIFDTALCGDRYSDNTDFMAVLGLPIPPELQEEQEESKEPTAELSAATRLKGLFHRECGSKKRRKAFNKLLRELDDFAEAK